MMSSPASRNRGSGGIYQRTEEKGFCRICKASKAPASHQAK
jgi:hypothetical protein